jgi:hypothetical protein
MKVVSRNPWKTFALAAAACTVAAPLCAQDEASSVPPPAPSTASAAGAAKGDPLDALDAAQLQNAISLLRRDHVRGSQVDEAALTRATLEGLLEMLSPGASLASAAGGQPVAAPFRSEILDGRAGYARLGSLNSENLAQLDAALRGFNAGKVHGVVLDLRATPESSDFALAARAASLFCTPGTELFSLAGPNRTATDFTAEGEPLFRGALVVIIDENTGGAAEALAATLRWNAKALLVGTRSSGRAVEFADVALADGANLRLAVAEALIAGQSVYPRGLRPDIEIAQDPAERELILAEALEKGAAVFVFEREREQMDEAALVAGTNPEIDSEPSAPGLIDRPLQRAADLVTALRVLRRPD